MSITKASEHDPILNKSMVTERGSNRISMHSGSLRSFNEGVSTSRRNTNNSRIIRERLTDLNSPKLLEDSIPRKISFKDSINFHGYNCHQANSHKKFEEEDESTNATSMLRKPDTKRTSLLNLWELSSRMVNTQPTKKQSLLSSYVYNSSLPTVREVNTQNTKKRASSNVTEVDILSEEGERASEGDSTDISS